MAGAAVRRGIGAQLLQLYFRDGFGYVRPGRPSKNLYLARAGQPVQVQCRLLSQFQVSGNPRARCVKNRAERRGGRQRQRARAFLSLTGTDNKQHHARLGRGRPSNSAPPALVESCFRDVYTQELVRSNRKPRQTVGVVPHLETKHLFKYCCTGQGVMVPSNACRRVHVRVPRRSSFPCRTGSKGPLQ